MQMLLCDPLYELHSVKASTINLLLQHGTDIFMKNNHGLDVFDATVLRDNTNSLSLIIRNARTNKKQAILSRLHKVASIAWHAKIVSDSIFLLLKM
jgi:hypothetical protein